jgi:hypothetical protein
MKSPTLADARKLNLLPSVTTILRVLDKPALNDWRVTQGVLAVMTSTQNPGESVDDFVHRVLQVERVQDQEGQQARDFGTEIHAALENYFLGMEVPEAVRPYAEPAAKAICARGTMVSAEKILVGNGYAGKTDLIQEQPDCWCLWDFKTTKKLPDKRSWDEHVLQLSAYAAAFHKLMEPIGNTKPIRTANCYLSSIEPGKFIILDNDPDWQKDYNDGFMPIVRHWQWKNSYKAQQ